MKIKYPKKSLGQNFLTDKNIIDIIIKEGNLKETDTVLEVGPGTGNLTEKILLKNPKKIIAIEKDKFLVKKLYRTFISLQNQQGIILALTGLLISCIPMVLGKIFKTSLISALLKTAVFNENKTGTASELWKGNFFQKNFDYSKNYAA